MKAEELAWFAGRWKIMGGEPRGWRAKFILEADGGREPIYEDTRSLGDWDHNSNDEAIIWLHRQR